jgi:uncharacterized protein DUF6174
VKKALAGALVVLLSAACHDSTGITQSLDDAEARWQQMHITNYTFTVAVQCFCNATAPVRVTVVNNVPTSVVFAKFVASYDATTGYPHSVEIDPKATVADDELALQITSFAAATP